MAKKKNSVCYICRKGLTEKDSYAVLDYKTSKRTKKVWVCLEHPGVKEEAALSVSAAGKESSK
jgi:hypothetical protein